MKAAFPLQFAFQGFCPVTYAQGNLRYESIVTGDPNFVAEFNSQLYSLASEDKVGLAN